MLRIQTLGLDLYGCHEALERLDDYLDRELAPAEQAKVKQHLRICLRCTRKFRFETELRDGIREKVSHVLLPGDVESLQSKIAGMLAQERDSKLDADVESNGELDFKPGGRPSD